MSDKIKISESELKKLIRGVAIREARQMSAFGGSSKSRTSAREIEGADRYMVNLKGAAGSGSYELKTEHPQDVVEFLTRLRSDSPSDYVVTVWKDRGILDQIDGREFLMKLRDTVRESVRDDIELRDKRGNWVEARFGDYEAVAKVYSEPNRSRGITDYGAEGYVSKLFVEREGEVVYEYDRGGPSTNKMNLAVLSTLLEKLEQYADRSRMNEQAGELSYSFYNIKAPNKGELVVEFKAENPDSANARLGRSHEELAESQVKEIFPFRRISRVSADSQGRGTSINVLIKGTIGDADLERLLQDRIELPKQI